MLVDECFTFDIIGVVQQRIEPGPVKVRAVEVCKAVERLGQGLFVLFLIGQAAAIEPLVEGVDRDVQFFADVGAHAAHRHAAMVGQHFYGFVEPASELFG